MSTDREIEQALRPAAHVVSPKPEDRPTGSGTELSGDLRDFPLSDVLQIASYKTRGKRVFRMAPVHYHFQMGGWTETQVVTRFWLVGLLGGFLGVALALTN